MLFKRTKAPQKSVQEFKSWIQKFNPKNIDFPDEIYSSHKVFHANPIDIISECGLSSAYQVAWRYIHTDEQGHHSTFEIRLGNQEDEHHFQETHSGSMAHLMKTFILKIERLEVIQKEHFELAFLRLYVLRINAIWLRATERENDYFIILPPYFYGFESEKLYNTEDFINKATAAVHKLSANAKSMTHDNMMGG